MNDQELQNWILEQLNNVPGAKKVNRRFANIVCPFHNDRGPSLGVRISNGTDKTPLGSLFCFACGPLGTWDKLAAKFGLKPLPKITEISETFTVPEGHERLISIGTEFEVLKKQLKLGSLRDWPEHEPWRGFSGKFLTKLGALKGMRFGQEWAFFLVYVDHSLMGLIQARLKKKEGELSYINSPGDWSKTSGLWPYDYVAQLSKDYVILVEGPRDAMRLIRFGMPALCTFGTKSLSTDKILLALNLDKRVFCMGDGDEAGAMFNKTCKDLAVRYGQKIRAITLAQKGKSYDPCAIPLKLLSKIKQQVEA